MAEAQICREETRIPDHRTVSAHLVGGGIDDPVTGKDLLSNRLRLRCSLGTRKINLALDSRQIEFEEPTPLDDLGGDRILTKGKGLQGNRFSSDHALKYRHVRTGQQSEIMTILLVDSFDVFSEDQVDPGAKLCVG